MTAAETNNATLMIRLPSELKAELMRVAAINGRRITSEINLRLKASLTASLNPPVPASYTAPRLVTRMSINEKSPDDLLETDRALLQIFRDMPYEKQLALLTLLK